MPELNVCNFLHFCQNPWQPKIILAKFSDANKKFGQLNKNLKLDMVIRVNVKCGLELRLAFQT